jgi:soluble lytic murein transglycosylase
MAAVHANRWADAEAAASHFADPVAAKLVSYYRLLAPGAATAQEIAAFVTTSPDWPAQALLERRRQEAIATDPDDAAVLAQCDQAVTLAAARLRCANALANAGHDAQAAAEARRAWITGFPTDAAGFPQRWRPVLTPADQWERYQTLAWNDAAAAARQMPLLDPPHRTVAEARLALQRDDPAAAARLAAMSRDLANGPASAPSAARGSAPTAIPTAAPTSGPINDPANDPGFMLDQARWLRRAGRTQDAVALWRASGVTAQQAAPSTALPAFWAERERLARQLLHDGNATAAYALIDDPGPITSGQSIDADFLAGFVALRMLHQPDAAMRHFQALAAASPAALTQGRAWYWLGRATAAAGQDPRPAYSKAAAWPTSFYGQLAALALNEDAAAIAARINALRDPPGTRDQAFGLTQREVVRAAALLVAWGEPRRAEAFLLRMDELAPDLPDRALTAQLAQWLGQPQTAVAIARRMGRDGSMLPQAGWPMPVDPVLDPPSPARPSGAPTVAQPNPSPRLSPSPPPGPAPDPAGAPSPGPLGNTVDPAIVLGLIRQESSFDSATVSPAGARGLMQLMPGTAVTVARQIGTTTSPGALVYDPQQNMRLGTAYVRELLDRYDNTLPLALAAYNAGPRRVDQWLAENGDPRVGPPQGTSAGTPAGTPTGTIDMIDWIEVIPFAETRNYVQRVLENIVIYRARRGETTPTLLAQWTR